jgi:hypothetical protein
MSGIAYPKNVSSSYPTDWKLNLAEALLLISGGVLAAVLHRTFDLSLGLPGHHGIEWMVLLILGRVSSPFRSAGTLTSIGAAFASSLPFLHGGNPLSWFFYLLPGPALDFAFYYLPRLAEKPWFLILLGGLAHVTKPFGQLTINLVTGWPFGSFRYGVLYPFASHLLFGMFGGSLAALILLGSRFLLSKSSSI